MCGLNYSQEDNWVDWIPVIGIITTIYRGRKSKNFKETTLYNFTLINAVYHGMGICILAVILE